MKRSFFWFLSAKNYEALPAITEWIRILWTSFILSSPGPLVLQQQAMPCLFYCQFLRTWRWRSLGTQNRRAKRKANPDDIIDKICHQFVGVVFVFGPARAVILVTECCQVETPWWTWQNLIWLLFAAEWISKLILRFSEQTPPRFSISLFGEDWGATALEKLVSIQLFRFQVNLGKANCIQLEENFI